MTNHAKVADYFPKAYDGKVTRKGKEMTIIEVATLLELPPIFVRHGDWAITAEAIECLTTEYDIRFDRLDENDWERQMDGKTWVNLDDFRKALWDAQEMIQLGILKVELPVDEQK